MNGLREPAAADPHHLPSACAFCMSIPAMEPPGVSHGEFWQPW